MYKMKNPRDRQVIFRLTGAEFIEVVAALELSEARSLSEYCRQSVLREARRGYSAADEVSEALSANPA